LLWTGLAIALVLVLVAVALFFVNRGTALALRPSDAATTGNTLLTSTAADIVTARASLEQLTVGNEPRLSNDYRRAAFGDAWTDTDGNGCNQRDDVLLRDLDHTRDFTVAQQGQCDHDVLAGTWLDPYTGTTITLTDAKEQAQAESVQIDHLVALSAAWRYGARSWSDAERLTFANDLNNLLAVGGPANQAKGGSDPSHWQPVSAARCGYAVRYIGVKTTYHLPTDAPEKQALADMLKTCG
jgi:hypothetical protein